MALQTLSVLDVTPLQENWDASLQAIITSFKTLVYSLSITITVQGDHTTPSIVTIQVQDLEGTAVGGMFNIRVRVANSGGYTAASNALIDLGVGTMMETISAKKDLVLQTNNSGTLEIQCTDATAETFKILVGPPDFGSDFIIFDNSLSVTHA